MRYSKDSVIIISANIDCLDQYRHPKFLSGKYAKEPLLKPFITYTDSKKVYPIHVFVLRFLVDHKNFKKNQVFDEYRGNLDTSLIYARVFTILIRRRVLKKVSGGKKY